MKKVLFIVICGLFAFNLYGCDKKNDNVDNKIETPPKIEILPNFKLIEIKVGDTINLNDYYSEIVKNDNYKFYTESDLITINNNIVTANEKGGTFISIIKYNSENKIIGRATASVIIY